MFFMRSACFPTTAALILAAVVGTLASGIEEGTLGGGEPSAEPYSFSYSAESVGGYSDRQESGDASGRVQGFYTMMGDDGRMRRVDYVADENGYRARISTNEIGTRTGPTGDAMYSVSQPSAGQLEAARVTAAQYAGLEEPHLLAARVDSARMTLVRDDNAWRSRIQAAPVTQQQVQQPSWRVASRARVNSQQVQDLSSAEETNLARQAVPNYQQQQQQVQVDRRTPINNNNNKIRANLNMNDLRQMWVEGADVEQQQQQQSNVVDPQDQVEITTTTTPSIPVNEPQVTLKSRPSPLPVREQTAQTDLPVVTITAGQEQVDVMIQSTGSGTTSTTTEQPTTTSSTMATTTTTVQEQEQTTTQEVQSSTGQVDSQQPITQQQVTTTTKRLQTAPVAPETATQFIVTRTSQDSTTEQPSTTTTAAAAVLKTTRQPIVIIETNRAALMEQPAMQQAVKQVSKTRFNSARKSGWRPISVLPQMVPQEPVKSAQVSREEALVFVPQERSTRAPVAQVQAVEVPQQQQVQSFIASTSGGVKGGSKKSGPRRQAFWRTSGSSGGELSGFGARTGARQIASN